MPALKVVQQEDAAETKRRKAEWQVLVARDHRGEGRRPDHAAQCRASCAHLQGLWVSYPPVSVLHWSVLLVQVQLFQATCGCGCRAHR